MGIKGTLKRQPIDSTCTYTCVLLYDDAPESDITPFILTISDSKLAMLHVRYDDYSNVA